MKRSLLSIVLALLTFAPAVLAAKAEVVDDGGFFSADAVRQANETLTKVERDLGRQMRVETYAAIPAELRAKYSNSDRRQFFQNWARQRAQQEGLTGVMVLICRDPSSLQVEVGKNTASSGAFTLADRSRMSQDFLAAMRAKEYDRGLLGAVNAFAQTAAKGKPAASGAKTSGVDALPVPNLPGSNQTSSAPRTAPQQQPAPLPQQLPQQYPQQAPSGRGGGSWSFASIIFLVILLFVGLSIVRRIFGIGHASNQPLTPGQHQGYGNGPNYGPGGAPGAGGDGFGRGFGGGLLGGLLGGWAANQMFNNHNPGNSAHAAPPPMDTGTFNEPSGSAFDGGGDFGGGGDFSGGGGDAGSGGGDF